ncbi:MAG: hypothetical protein JXQ30_10570 [Spirochaetes bacterium]|nr:hypothetical protein [Spirochaetota bacterium]
MGTRTYTVKDWVYIGLFGALWGAIELSLGTILHVLFPPVANTFFTGIILTAIGCVIVLCSRFLVEHRGSVLLVGLVTAVLKLVSPGGVKLGPIVAILMESVLMEGALFLSSKKRASVFMTAGVLALVWNFVHRFVMLRLLYGKHVTEVAVKMAKGASGIFGFAEEKVAAILLTLLLIQIVCGTAAGYLAFRLGSRIVKRRESAHEG